MSVARTARWLPLALTACAGPRDVAVRIRPPALVDAGASADAAPTVLDEIFRPGERCVALGAASLDTRDDAARVTVFRTRSIVARDAPSCLGAPGTVLVPDLLTSAEYLVEMVILEPDDYARDVEPDPLRERVVSLQDLPLPGNATPGYICLSDPTRSRAWPAILRPAAAACRSAPLRDPCVLSMPYGGVCPVGSR